MSLAKFRKVYGKNGSGRFVISEGVAPAAYLTPHPSLPTLYTDLEDSRFEIVITKGTILSVVADSNGDSRFIPANGTEFTTYYNDGTGSTPNFLTVHPKTAPVGCAQYDLYRTFDKGTSQGAGWINTGYVEWPMVTGLNDNISPGDYVRSDNIGRPVLYFRGSDFSEVEDHMMIVGIVIEVEKFVTNFDDGLLSYMLLPSDPGALKTVYELTQSGTNNGKLGIRANLDIANVMGAMRVMLTT